MASSSTSSKKIVLKSSDGETFEVDDNVASQCQTIKFMMEDLDDSNDAIPLPNVTATILSKIIEYCKKHAVEKSDSDKKSHDKEADDELKNWDNEFLKVDKDTLFDLILAANYMDIKGLLDLTCQCVADMIKGKTPEEIRKILNIVNDFTPEEEEAIRKENQWAFG